MTLQWKRKFRLTIQVDSNEPRALDFSEFRCVFQVSQATSEQPKAAQIFIYNVSAQTMNLLAGVDNQKTDTTVILECAYGSDQLQTIFKGRVFQYRRGRENPTDTFLCVLAISGDKVQSEALINQCVPSGTTINELGNVVVEEAKKSGMEVGELVELSTQAYPRGRVLFGSLHGYIQKIGKENNVIFDYSDDVLSSVDIDKYSIEPMQILTPTTGLVGMPELTSEGLNVKCLLNPKLKRMGRVQVDMTNLITQQYDIAYKVEGKDQVHKNPKTATNAEGIFVIQAIEHNGDTRGDEWYTTMVCTAVGAAVPKSGIVYLAVGE